MFGNLITSTPGKDGTARMRMIIALTIALVAALVAWSASASAEPLEPMCTATYAARLADAQQAIEAQSLYMIEWRRVMPWFERNCRMLTELERTVRGIDHPSPFVCRTRKGMPAGLTAEFIAEHSEPLGIEIFQEHTHLDDICAPFDLAAGRMALVLREPTPQHVLAVYCAGSDKPVCAKARAIAAKGSPAVP